MVCTRNIKALGRKLTGNIGRNQSVQLRSETEDIVWSAGPVFVVSKESGVKDRGGLVLHLRALNDFRCSSSSKGLQSTHTVDEWMSSKADASLSLPRAAFSTHGYVGSLT